MKKSFCLMLVFIIAFLTSACGNSTKNDENTLSFPANDYAKTEFNSKIYDMEKFSLSLNLPDGWSAKKREAEGEEFVMLSVFSKYDILNKDKELVGVAGFNVYEPYEGAEEEPAAIYNQIALGNDYQFDVRDSYNVVNETETGKTAVTDVYYAASVNNGKEKHNKGIVSYNKDLKVYVALEFEDGKITDKELQEIAKSAVIKK